MEDWCGVLSKSRGGKKQRDEDFQEEDVWAVVKEREDSSPKLRKSKEYSAGSSSAWPLPAAPRVISRAKSGGHEAKMAQQSSAPVNIPDWSKTYKKYSKKGQRDGSYVDEEGENNEIVNIDDENEEEEDDDEMVPPHEYIARRLARSQIASFSMCEGVGRTLKGRDLSKLRNAILTKTGFLE